ncbi:MAG: hypothetical protein LIP23_09215 [Planctomycetes bacterium]|nr:hypothetical protein [Planctomycetota bacterium]
MENSQAKTAVYQGEDGESVFPIPFQFNDGKDIWAEIIFADGRTHSLTPGLEYLVNVISDGNGELILLEEELERGDTLCIRKRMDASAALVTSAAAVAGGENGDDESDRALLAEIRNQVEVIGTDVRCIRDTLAIRHGIAAYVHELLAKAWRWLMERIGR